MLGRLFIVSAASGAGKTSLVRAAVKEIPNLEVSVSYTTRTKRPNEVDGVDYHFVSEKEFLCMQQEQKFLESATVFEHFYGTSKEVVLQKLHSGIDIILEIDWQGARLIAQQHLDAVGVFILPPSLETLQARLESRGQDSAAVIQSRLEKACRENAHYNEYDFLIINNEFQRALAAFTAIIHADRLRLEAQQARNRTLLQQLVQRK